MGNTGGNESVMKCVCPECHAPLSLSVERAQCSGCAQEYPIRDDIVLFAQPDDFYEGTFVQTWGQGNRLWWWIKERMVSRWRYLLRWVPPQASVMLDVGCGGGNMLIKRQEHYMVGIDLSWASLKSAAQVYDEVYGANIAQLPFENGSFDCVLSLDVLGHIPPEQKDRAVAEMFRVLRSGGRTIHYIETAGLNRFQAFAQSHPRLYQRYFIDLDGHYGLELPSQAISRFRDIGFVPLTETGIEVGVIRSLREYLKRFDNQYRSKSRWISWSVRLYRLLGCNPITRYSIEAVLAAVMNVGQAVMPLDSADSIFVCYEKP